MMRNNRTGEPFESWRVLAQTVLVCAFACWLGTSITQADVVAIEAARVYTADGAAIDDGIVLIEDGKVVAIGADIAIPENAQVIKKRSGVITPGLIDAMCVVNSEAPQAAERQRFAGCPQCAEAHRDHLRAVSPEAAFAPEQCALCRHEHEHHACARCAALGVGGRCAWCAWADSAADRKRHEESGSICPICQPLDHLDDDPFSSAIDRRDTWAEQVSETIPHVSVLDSVNPYSSDFERLVASGVTTVYVSPDSASVIGARGAVLKTAGPPDRRVVVRDSAIKATVATDPARRGRSNVMPPGRGPGAASFMVRRPMTRMGVYWVFRKAFYDAIRAGQGLPVSGADTPPSEALPVLRQILAGEIPLRIHSRMQHDILSALRLAHEFGLRFTLEEATDAYKCLSELKATQTPVIYGPIYMEAWGFRRSGGETEDARLDTPKRLRDADITFALTAQEMRDEESLARQAMMAVRYGLTPSEALQAVTTTPAAMLNVSDRLGTLKPGADADLVVWSGEPFAATTRPVLVLIDGKVVYQQ